MIDLLYGRRGPQQMMGDGQVGETARRSLTEPRFVRERAMGPSSCADVPLETLPDHLSHDGGDGSLLTVRSLLPRPATSPQPAPDKLMAAGQRRARFCDRSDTGPAATQIRA